MENASLFLAGVPGIDAVFTGHQHLVFPAAAIRRHRRRRQRQGHADGQAGGHGRLLGLAYGPDRPDARARRQRLADRLGHESRRVRSTSASTASRRRRSRTTPRSTPSRPTTRRRSPISAARSARPSAPLFTYFALVADDPSVQIVSQAQTWYITQMMEGTKWEGPADPFGRRAVQGRRPRRSGLLHRRPRRAVAIKNVADLYLYPNTVRAVDHQRRPGQGLARDVGRHLQPGRRRGKADQPLINDALPVATISMSSTASPTRSTCPSRPNTTRRAVSSMRTPAASSICLRRQAGRLRTSNSSSPPTTTGPAAAAISRASTTR